jgi:hypothetical protein
MKRSSIFCLILILTSIIWSGCISEDAEDVNQERIRTNYLLQYNAGTERTYVSASFIFGSTFLKLNSPSGVTFNDQSLKETEILGIVSYDRTFNGEVDEAKFVYENSEANIFENTLELAAPIDLSDTITQISISQGALIPWVGNKSGARENIELIINNGDVSFYDYIEALNATSFEIKPNELNINLTGAATIRMNRRLEMNLDETPDAGGSGSSIWESEEYAIQIVP